MIRSQALIYLVQLWTSDAAMWITIIKNVSSSIFISIFGLNERSDPKCLYIIDFIN